MYILLKKSVFFYLSIILFLVSTQARADIVPAAVPDIVLTTTSPAGTPMDVAYNPVLDLYYSVAGGNSGVPIWTYDGTTGATLLRTAPGNHDFRGLWWNDNLNQLETNSCRTCTQMGIWAPDLDTSGYALGTGTVIHTPANQPDFQSQGDYNDVANEVVYYDSGQIFTVDRDTNASLLTIPITGLPVPFTDLNQFFIAYTGMAGAEYMVWDHVNERALFVDSSGAYQGESVVTGGPNTNSNWNVGYANGRVFIWNGTGWNSYIVNTADTGTLVPVPTISFWGLIMLIFVLGIFGMNNRRNAL